ncbi:OAS2-like protein, partial [Mya arenaria]
CPFSCGKGPFGNKARRRHVHKFHGPLPNICDVCKEPFLSERALQMHEEDKHSGTSHRAHEPFKVERHPIPIADLYLVEDLDVTIANVIQPDKKFLSKTRRAVDKLVKLIQHNLPTELTAARVFKGGSLGKGTAVKGKSDIDLIVMMSNISEVSDLTSKMPKILQEMETSLQTFAGVSVVGNSKHSVQITFNGLSVDILPTLNVKNKRSLKRLYRNMTDPHSLHTKEFYSATLCQLQTALVGAVPTKVKSLILLIKYWNKEKVKPVVLSRTPTSYVYEIIILDRWVKADKPKLFDMRRAAHDVLTALVHHKDLQVLTAGLAKYSKDTAQIRHDTYIMDPCNPTNDLYNSRNWNWDGVASEAKCWLKSSVFDGVSGTTGHW